ncbi:MAG: helix-turn-helix transcriptional regulator [Niabella sp.]|nr:helix-turn-helix transcriptional regulator [Niabella sp.]
MKKQFEDLTEITDKKTFENARVYFEELIQYATKNGHLAELDADNKYTREMGRIGGMIADYESLYMKFKHLKVKNPLIISIEKQMQKKDLNQRQTAALLDVKENTLSQIMSGKRGVSMQMAKRLYSVLKIDPKTIIEFA